MKIVLALITLFLYCGAAFGLLQRLLYGAEGFPGRAVSLGLGAAGALSHAALLLYTGLGANGLSLGFFGAASLIGWLMATLLLLVSLQRPIENLGIAILPIAGIAALLNILVGHPEASAEPLAPGLASHVISSVLAYSLLSLAAFQALLLALQEHRLRHHHPGGFVRMLPPLQTMERLLFQMLLLGFLALTSSLLSGFLFLEDMFAQQVAHKTFLSIVAWLVFGILLLGHWRFGWRGQTAIRWTLGGFVVLMLAFFGSQFVLEFILRRD